MSRNLGRTSCAICNSDIVLDEAPRPVTLGEVKPYTQYIGCLIVANAHCASCDAKYLAWVRQNFTRDGSSSPWRREPREDGPPFVDLSFRASFDDEPAANDLPTPEKLAEIHAFERKREALALWEEAEKLLLEAAAIERDAIFGSSRWERYRQ